MPAMPSIGRRNSKADIALIPPPPGDAGAAAPLAPPALEFAADPPPLGACQLLVHAIEGRDMAPRDANGSSDPVCKVHFKGEQRHTRVVENSLSPIWDETMAFDFEIHTQYQLDTQLVTIEVWDSDRVTDDLIGRCEMDLGKIWRSPDHEIYRQWVAIIPEVDGEFEGVQGYIRLSVCVLPEGQEMKTIHDQIDEDDLVDVLMPPSIEMVGAQLKVNCFKADGLPELDGISRSGQGCDPYITVDVAGCSDARTAVQESTITPEWNETLCVPILMPKTGPPTSDRVRIGVWDQDGLLKNGLVDDDRIGSATIHLDEIDQVWKNPCWVCIYGAPHHVTTGGDQHREQRGLFGGLRDWLQGDEKNIARAMDAGLTPGSAYRGRILISAELDTDAPEPKLICNGHGALPPSINAEPPPNVKYCLRAFVLEGNGMPVGDKAGSWLFGSSGTGIEISMGENRVQTKLVATQEGRSCWYQELELANLEFPDDVTQLPDVFVNLVSGDDGQDRLSYYRINAMAQAGGLNALDLHGLEDMRDDQELPRARWYSLKRDVFGHLGSGHYPGSLLLCVGFGRMDGKPIRTRKVSRTTHSSAHSSAQKLQADSITLEGLNSNENENENENKNDSLESKTAALSGRQKAARLAELTDESLQVQASLAAAKTSVLALNRQMQRHLSVRVIEARDLKDTEMFGKIDPYVKLTLGGKDAPAGPCTVKQTRTLDDGGHVNPRWDEMLQFSDLAIDQDNLIIDVYDEDVGSDDHLGCVRLPLIGIFEARDIVQWVDLEEEGGGNAGRCGELKLAFVYSAPEDDGLNEKFKEASNTLQGLQQKQQGIKREQRLLSEKDEQKSLTPPDEEPYRLLVHVFQAKNLPPADGSGSADPCRLRANIASGTGTISHVCNWSACGSNILRRYSSCRRYIIASIGGSTKETTKKKSTLHPHWYETLSFDLNLPMRDHIEAGLAPELILQLFDHDLITADDYMGASHLLISLQLINLNSEMVKVPSDIRPKMRRCTVEMMLLGCRGLKTFNYITPMAPYVNFQLNGEAADKTAMLTKPAMLPSPEDPNYLEIVKISCFIPEDPVFTPTLNAKVHDKRFGGLREPLLGTAAIELKHYLPWVDKNRELIMKRHNLANTFRDAANRAGVMSKTTSAPRPTVSPADSNADDMFENEEKEPLVPPGGSDEPEPELEHAPEQSSIPRSVSSSFVSPENGSDDQEDVPPWREGRLIDGKILDNEWEDAMKQDRLKVTAEGDLSLSSTFDDAIERVPFDTWALHRHSQTAFDLMSGCVGSLGSVGNLKGLIRIIDHSSQPPPGLLGNPQASSNKWGSGSRRGATERRTTTSDFYKTANYMPWPIQLSSLLRPTAVVVRVYCIQAIGLQSMDKGNTADPFLEVKLGGNTQESPVIKETLDPYFGHCFEFESTLPGPSKLEVVVLDHDVLMRNDEIGRTTIDLEDRFFGTQWQALRKKPLERRTLRLEGSKVNRGKIELWVDVMSKAEAAKQPTIDISMAPPCMFELRMIIWRARNMPAMDILTQSNDLYFSTHVATVDSDGRKPQEEMQETDTHWRSGNGKGSFNWRCLFDIELPQHSRSPARLSIKGWDKDPMTFSSDLIGYTEINLNRALFKEGLRKYNALQRREAEIDAMDLVTLREKVDLLGEVELGAVGKVDPATGKATQLKGKIKIPADATVEACTGSAHSGTGKEDMGLPLCKECLERYLRKILRDFSEGEAGTIVRWEPSGQEKAAGDSTSPLEDGGDGGWGATAVAKAAKKAKKDAEKAIQSALRVGSDNTPRFWIDLKHPNTDEAVRGEVEVSIELLPKSLADRRKAGLGREAPNAFPVLPEPEGRVELSIFSPFATFKALVGNKLYSQICSILFCMVFAVCCWFMVPLVGSQVISNALNGGD